MWTIDNGSSLMPTVPYQTRLLCHEDTYNVYVPLWSRLHMTLAVAGTLKHKSTKTFLTIFHFIPACVVYFQNSHVCLVAVFTSAFVLATFGAPQELSCLDMCIESIYSCDAECTQKDPRDYMTSVCLRACGKRYLACERSCQKTKMPFFRRSFNY